jgi:hypothetical protein
MPPRLQRGRDHRVTRITRADARANPAVQAAVNANVLASRGLADLPTAAETAAIEQSVVDDRNNRPPPAPKKKRNAGAKPTGIEPKKKETKEERRLRRKKEKAEAAKKAAKKAAKEAAEADEAAKAIEAVEAAKALEAVEAAKALEAIKAAEAAEAVKNKGGKGGKGKNGGKTKSKSGNGSGGEGSPKISGTELQKRLKGVKWENLSEEVKAELFAFVRAGGTVEDWEKKRAEKEAMDELTEKIGYVSSEDDSGEEEGGEEEGGEEEGGEEEGGEEEGGEEEDGKEEAGQEGSEDTDEEYEDSEGVIEPETDGDEDDIPGRIICFGPRSESENGGEPEIESDPEVDDEEDYGSDDISCPGSTDIESGSESDNVEEDDINWHCISPRSPPTSGNQTADVNGGGPNSKSSRLDPNKSFGKNVAGKKRKPEDSPEEKPAKNTKLDDYSGGKVNICYGPRDHTPRRWDTGATTAVPQDPSKAKKPLGKKRKGDELLEPNSSGKKRKVYEWPEPIFPIETKRKGDNLPEANPWKRDKREETIICRLPEYPPKKSQRDEGIICAIPTSWATDRRERRAKEAASANAKKSSGTKRKSAESAEKKSSMKRVREEEPKGSKGDAGKKVGWLW